MILQFKKYQRRLGVKVNLKAAFFNLKDRSNHTIPPIFFSPEKEKIQKRVKKTFKVKT